MSARVFNKQTPKDADYNDFTSIDAYLEFSKNYDRQLLRRQKSLANRARYTNISIIILLLTVSISMAYYTYFLEQNTGKIVENILEKHPEYILTKKDIVKRIHPVNVKIEAIKDHSIILEKKIQEILERQQIIDETIFSLEGDITQIKQSGLNTDSEIGLINNENNNISEELNKTLKAQKDNSENIDLLLQLFQ